MRYALPLLLTALLGCYSPRALSPGPYGPEPFERVDGPIEATLFFDEHTGVAQFALSRPAHVAIFALRPGADLAMIYPARGISAAFGALRPGSHSVRTAGRSYRFASSWSAVYGATPTYILLIASERPMDVNRFMVGERLRHMLWGSILGSPYRAIEALAQEVVPNPASDEWTYAIQAIWPQSAWPDSRRGPWYIQVRCPDGRVMTVPAEAYYRGYVACPMPAEPADPPTATEDSTVRSVLPPRPRGPAGTSASTTREGVRGATPTRPTPPGWVAGSRLIADDDDRWGQVLRGIRRAGGGPDDERTTVGVPVRPRTQGIRGGFPPEIRDRDRRSARRPTWSRPSNGTDRVRPRTPARPRIERATPSRPAARPARPAPPSKPKAKPRKPSGGGG